VPKQETGLDKATLDLIKPYDNQVVRCSADGIAENPGFIDIPCDIIAKIPNTDVPTPAPIKITGNNGSVTCNRYCSGGWEKMHYQNWPQSIVVHLHGVTQMQMRGMVAAVIVFQLILHLVNSRINKQIVILQIFLYYQLFY
jgi:hypothetical protein